MPTAEHGFSPLAVANGLIEIAHTDGGIDHLTLQKELYVAHGLHLALANSPLVRHGFQAWQYGPVSPDVYRAARDHREWKIMKPLSAARMVNEQTSTTPDPEYAEQLLRYVWGAHRGMTPYQLIALTHRQGTPWHALTSGGELIERNARIPDESIRRYYQAVLERD